MSHTIETLAAQIAADSAKFICQNGTQIAGHLGLAYGVHKIMEATNSTLPASSRIQQAVTWLNPLPKMKKLTAFAIAEAATHTESLRTPLGQVAANTSDLSTKFLAPLLEKGLKPVIEYCVEKNYIALPPAPAEPWYSKWWPLMTTTTAAAIPTVAPSPLAPHPALQWAVDAYHYADQNAPQAGKLTADMIERGIKKGVDYVNYPKEVIAAISDATGISYPMVLAGAIGVGTLAYLGLKTGYNRMQQTVTQQQNTRVQTNSQAQGNVLNVQVVLPNPPPAIIPARRLAATQAPTLLAETESADELNMSDAVDTVSIKPSTAGSSMLRWWKKS